MWSFYECSVSAPVVDSTERCEASKDRRSGGELRSSPMRPPVRRGWHLVAAVLALLTVFLVAVVTVGLAFTQGRPLADAALGVTAGLFAWRVVRVTRSAPLVRDLVSLVVGIVAVQYVSAGYRWHPIDVWPAAPQTWLAGSALFYLLFARPAIARRRAEHRPDASLERRSPNELTADAAADLVDALDRPWGSTRMGGPNGRRGCRAAHTHGDLVQGTFAVDGAFAASTTVAPFALPTGGGRKAPPPTLEATARFSNFSGAIARNDAARNPHGFALRLQERDQPWPAFDAVCVDVDRFVVSNREDFFGFAALLPATWPDPGGARHRPSVLRWFVFLLFQRTTIRALLSLWLNKIRSSYLDRTYHGLNTFHWSIEGRDRPVRYRFVPLHEPRAVTMEAGSDKEHRLQAELGRRLQRKMPAVQFRFELVEAPAGLDEIRLLDPTRPFPRRSRVWTVGTLTLLNVVDDDRDIAFNPHNLPDGVRASDDEVLMARRAAYAESHARRAGPGPTWGAASRTEDGG